MMPTPMPAPIEPSPAPTPRAIALPASVTPVSVTPWAAWAIGIKRSIGVLLLSYSFDIQTVCILMALRRCAADVDRGEGREDKGLQGGDQSQLEDEEGE